MIKRLFAYINCKWRDKHVYKPTVITKQMKGAINPDYPTIEPPVVIVVYDANECIYCKKQELLTASISH